MAAAGHPVLFKHCEVGRRRIGVFVAMKILGVETEAGAAPGGG
jgi:protein tyrosine/serine phosphatase